MSSKDSIFDFCGPMHTHLFRGASTLCPVSTDHLDAVNRLLLFCLKSFFPHFPPWMCYRFHLWPKEEKILLPKKRFGIKSFWLFIFLRFFVCLDLSFAAFSLLKVDHLKINPQFAVSQSGDPLSVPQSGVGQLQMIWLTWDMCTFSCWRWRRREAEPRAFTSTSSAHQEPPLSSPIKLPN